MGARMRAYPWHTHPLGHPEHWPVALRVTVRILLTTQHPLFIFWGPEHRCFYNDAYSRSIGPEKDAVMLGAPGRECWREIWHIIGPQIDHVLSGGGATWHENQLVPIIRHGRREDVYWTYSYSPIEDAAASAGVGGVLVICNETTAQVLADRRHAFLVELDDAFRSQRHASSVISAGIDLLGRHLGANRVGFGIVQADDETIVLETTYVDGVVPLVGAYPLSGFGPRNIVLQRQGVTVVHNDVADAPDIDVARYEAIQTRAFVSVPLVRDGRFRASLFVNAAQPREWSKGEVSLIESVAARLFDAVERSRAEQEMQRVYDETREERNRLSLVLDNISEEVWFHDASGRVILANPAAQKAFGEVDGREITAHAASIEIFHPDGTPRRVDENPIVRALAGEEVRDLEELVKLPVSGELRTRCVTSIPARGSDGEVLGVVSLVRDVTERAAAEQALALSRSRLDYATRLSGVGFWYCDLPFDELRRDDRVKEYFFFEPAARITIDDFYARIHEEDRGPTRDAIDASISNRMPYDIVYRTVDPTTGAIKWIRALGGTDYASDGTPLHFDGVAVDVSAQKLDQLRLASLNLQLREQDRRKDEFLATLSHELRNPLAPIRTAAQILGAANLQPEQLQSARSVIQRQVRHMALLLDDLLDIARITQGKLLLKKARVTLTSIVDTAVEAARPLLDEKRQRLSVSLPSGPLWLEADPLRLSQILANLLTNAAKYSNAGGHIEIFSSVDICELCLTIRDEGIGIPPELLNRIFDMFSQLDSGSARSDGGLGIGLALVKGLVELHAGTVEAKSAGPGQGSQFTVRLPVVAREGGQELVSAFKTLQEPRPGRRVLIADDNKDAAESLAMLLQMGGHEVCVAHDGRAALDLAQSFRPEVALLDIGMPKLSGYEVATHLRGEPWGATIRLFALTGWGQDGDRQRTKESGFDLHLTKPIDLDALESLLSDNVRIATPQS